MGIDNFVDNTVTNNQLLTTGPIAAGRQSMSLTDQSIINDGVERYVTDYYSGNQVMVFLSDLWIDDLTMIQFQAHQNKRPFYGYKSQRWDTVAAGTQIVEGVFALNYTHTNYLNMAVAYALKKNGDNVQSSQGRVNDADVAAFIQDIRNNPLMLQNLSYDQSGNPVKFQAPLNLLSFDDKANLLEDALWGAPKSQALHENDVISPDNLPGFDIVISFGNYPQDRPAGGKDEVISSHTTKIINDVRILSHSIQASVTGEPIQEVYTFIARGIDFPLTRSPLRFSQSSTIGTSDPANTDLK